MIAAVLFDMDGLLLNTQRVATSVIAQGLSQHYRLEATQELLFSLIGRSEQGCKELIAAACRAVPGLPEYCHKTFTRYFESEYKRRLTKEGVAMKEGVIGLLDLIDSLDLQSAVVTSSTAEQAAFKLSAAGIKDRFQLVVTGDEVAASKPAPDIYLTALKKLQVCAEHAIALEDSNNGAQAALAAHCRAVIVIPDLVPPSEHTATNVTAVLPSLTHVNSWLSLHMQGR